VRLFKNLPIVLVLIFFLTTVLYLVITEIENSKVKLYPEGPITITGHLVCLPHINDSGPQTMECAFGLVDAEGNYFRLKNTDPENNNINSISGDTNIEIQGVFIPGRDKVYQGVGLIEISKITQIE